MKRILLLMTLLLSSLFLLSQSIVNTSKKWSNLHFHSSTFSLTTEFIRFNSDTMINSVQYKRVEISVDPGQNLWSFYGYARETSDKKVYFRINAQQAEKLLYNLSASAGDSLMVWSLYDYSSGTLDSMMYHVTSIDSILIGNNYRKQLHLSIRTGTSFLEVGQWVDSLGCLSAGMLHNSTGLVGGDSYTLLCFFENSVLKYHLQGYTGCYIVIGIGEKKDAGMEFLIFPNPLTSVSILKSPEWISGNKLTLDIFNTSFQKVIHIEFTDIIKLYREMLTPGLYFYTISHDQKIIGKGKLAVK